MDQRYGLPLEVIFWTVSRWSALFAGDAPSEDTEVLKLCHGWRWGKSVNFRPGFLFLEKARAFYFHKPALRFFKRFFKFLTFLTFFDFATVFKIFKPRDRFRADSSGQTD